MKIIVSCFIDTLILFWFNRRLDRRKGYAAVQAACFFGMAALTVFMNKNGMDSLHRDNLDSLQGSGKSGGSQERGTHVFCHTGGTVRIGYSNVPAEKQCVGTADEDGVLLGGIFIDSSQH